MNREIKFRVWDKSTSAMIPFTDIDIRFVNGELEVCYWLEQHYEGGGDIHTRDICETINDPILMQFTGLKDKNGKDIYEGDIVKFHYFYGSLGGNLGFQESEHELSGVVKYGQFGWGLESIKGEHWKGYTGYKNGEGSSNFLDLLAMNESAVHEESFEIIGNIYETPELLNQQ